ncbi:MAG: 2Fe-2S iron-sulfur cluster binding domain-containing protein [Candidatus Hydrogenedentes bacterium]|nr:2Fe-2S iron-sulfur cluster binding domain-containing protein [Candidatus Hydrogenedentota bacterium]
MPRLNFEGRDYALETGESVLECLERHGVALTSSCRSGVCHSCLIRVLEGAPPPAAQKGVKETLRAQGYYLACCCRPDADLKAERGAAQQRYRAIIESVHPLNATVARLRLTETNGFTYFPGQFLNLVHASGQVRSYSIASVPREDAWLELHVGLLPGGCISTWVHHEAAAGESVEFLGPQGNCFYVPGRSEQPLLLLGTGTGLAPLYGILRDALGQGHTGPIHLFHGSVRRDGLYLVEALRALEAEWPQFHYHPCVLEGPAEEDIAVGAIDQLALERVPSLKGFRVFLCGHPDLVRQMQRKTFLAGASLSDIYADAFLPAAAAASTPS